VEFALVMPILALLLFGMVEFGLNVNDYEAIRQGVRDASRQAVVADYGTNTAGINCVPAAATQAANSAAVQCTTRKAAGSPGLAVKVVYTDLNGATDFSVDRVKVCAIVKAKSVTGLLKPFLNGVYLKSSVEMRAEKNLTLSPSVQDNDPSNQNWSWC